MAADLMAANRTPRTDPSRWRRARRLGLGAAAALLALAARAPAQNELDAIERARAAQEDAGNGIFSLPRSQDDIARWLEAIEDIESQRYADAAQRLHDLLVRSRGTGSVPTTSPNRFLGLRAAVVQTLRDLPEAGKDAYEKLAQREIGYLLRRDPNSLGPAELAEIGNRFPATEAGRTALLRLADLALERGDGPSAESWLRAAEDAVSRSDPRRRAIERRRDVARLLILGRDGRVPDAEAEAIRDELAPSLPADPMRGWPAYGGGYDDARPMASPVGDLHDTRRFRVPVPGFRRNPLSMHAVGDLGGIYLNNGLLVTAIDPLRGEIAWESRAPIANTFAFEDVEDSINPTMALAPAVGGDLVVASLQVADEVVGSNQNRQFRTIRVINKIPVRRLFAFDRVTGKQVWSHWDEQGGDVAARFRGHNVAGSPVIQGDTVYVASHDQTGAIEYYLSAYDLHTGEPKWRRLICSSQQEVNMFGNAEQEFAAAPLAVVGGVVYGATNLGVVFAANASDGTMRWLSAYDVIELPPARLHQSDVREWFFQNNPPVVLDGVVAFTPVDSREVLAYDADDGRLLWKLPFRPDGQVTLRWLVGTLDDEFVLGGAGLVGVTARQIPERGFRPEYRVIAPPEDLGLLGSVAASIGRAAITEDRIWQTSPEGLVVVDRHGRRTAGTGEFTRIELQRHANLLLVDGIAITNDDEETRVHLDRNALRRSAERRANENPDDPEALLRLASLVDTEIGEAFESPVADRAERLYRQALEAARRRGLGPGNATFDVIAERLFDLGMARARTVAVRSPERGLELLRAIRDEAPRADAWITAQRAILGLVVGNDSQYLTELDLLAAEQGPTRFTFSRGAAAIPVAAWALWQGVDATHDPAAALQRLQRLLEQYGDVVIEGRPAEELAFARMRELIERHGHAPYAPIETRAAALLDAAGDAPERLREVVRRFPHSDAARQATGALLDAAAASGDLAAATRFYSDGLERGEPAPGVLRRLLAAARARGNEGLAEALARRLRERYAEDASDYAPDGGASYAEVFARPGTNERPGAPNVRVPRTIVGTIAPPSIDKPLRMIDPILAPGRPAPADLPLYAILEDFWILGYDVDDALSDPDRPLFRARVGNSRNGQVFLSGNSLVINDTTSIRAIDYRSGEALWDFQAGDDYVLMPIGLRAGLLCVYERHIRAGDGGSVLALETASGSVLWRRWLSDDRTPTQPILSTPRNDDLTETPKLWIVDGENLVALDLLTGLPTDEFALEQGERAFLGIEQNDLMRVQSGRLQGALRADRDTVFVSLPPTSRDAPSRVLALDHSGKERWRWLGSPGLALELCEPDGAGGLVLVERSMTRSPSRIVCLDKIGLERREAPLGRSAYVRNGPRQPGLPLPGSLLITDQTTRGETPRVVCENLDGSIRSFEHKFPNADYVSAPPVLGPEFLAVPVGRKGSTQELHVLDLSFQRSLLPNGPIELSRNGAGIDIVTVGEHVVAQTIDGLVVLGDAAK
jgi:outer membrane protein assembly factor BamB